MTRNQSKNIKIPKVSAKMRFFIFSFSLWYISLSGNPNKAQHQLITLSIVINF
ncbi:MAG: hypothetical protein K0S31_386 [Sphingobacterium multivorum]|jgi:hypothetical protein|nr:hypothetical protein [Sphingobacterium multivorum]